jgi:DNA-binding transcriptional LysR family regulator
VELRQLRYFAALAEDLHFSRAATRLGIAQPALSQQIARLEESLGVVLFERNRNGVQMTDAGRSLLRDSRRIMSLVDEATMRAEAASKGLVGELNIGFVGGLHFSLPKAIDAIQQQLPGTRISLLELTFDQLMSSLYDEGIDLGLFRQWTLRPPMHVETIGYTPLVVALPKEHLLCARSMIPLRDLATESFIFYSRTIVPGYAERVGVAFGEIGVVPRVVQEVFIAQVAFSFVAAGRGITLVPQTARNARTESQVEFRDVVEPVITVPTVAAWRQESRSQLRSVILDGLRKHSTLV